MTQEDVNKVKEHGKVHLEFCMKLYRIQHENKLYFLHEHPFTATSWQNEKVQEVLKLSQVQKVKSHMCAFGVTSEDEHGKGLVKKPTGFMTNAPELAKRLSQECTNDHRWQSHQM